MFSATKPATKPATKSATTSAPDTATTRVTPEPCAEAPFAPAAPTATTTPCPRCARPLRTARNPYYGVSLAVHEWLYVCDRCGCTRFATPVDDGLVVVQPEPERPEHEAFLRLARRIRRLRHEQERGAA
ncbi:hypothetical protein [Curtobacterium sp. ISL-83]|uniref:hypothetical protein n=1 Tax=Curtobacterium sp. ISL-83 TaxID=2819145 RepID=UPI001BE6942C|nr:hypothetical protein [Curtobacterium sp. ISL-83]MBT2502118.1 hypothetical protein [Curtobacterium sp. ISL-83]